jgi:GH24 family phage-related lysozyme (muramidase)
MTLQRRAISGTEPIEVPRIVHDVLRSPGQPLDAATQAFFEQRFGHDFSKVRVHTDSLAAESAQAVHAYAYTAGQDVVFGAAQYAPGTGAGNRLLAHELTHVVQGQGGQGVRSARPISSPADAAEREAESIGRMGWSGPIAPTQAAPVAGVFREAGPGHTGATQPNSTGEMVPDDPYPGVADGAQPALFSLSHKGFNFIRQHEGNVLHLYDDPAGHCTIGVGHLVHLGRCNGTEPANFRRGLTNDEALHLFKSDLGAYEKAVSNGVASRLNQYYFDALVSFTYNVGIPAFQGSGVLKQMNAKHYSKVPNEMMKWVKPSILRARRTDEANLFRTGNYA